MVGRILSEVGLFPIRSVITKNDGQVIIEYLPNKNRKDVDDHFGGTGLYINSGWEYEHDTDVAKNN